MIRLRVVLAVLIASIFVCSVAFIYVFAIDGSMDGSEAMNFAVMFAAVFIILNAVLLAFAYMVFRKAKAQGIVRRCILCGSVIDANARTCGKCNAIQPASLDENTYLGPKERSDEIIKKK